MNNNQKLQAYISCPPGLEPVLREEVRVLGIKPATVSAKNPPITPAGEEPGGIEVEATLTDIYRCNLHLRSASRVVVRLGSFYAAAFSELRKKASRLAWDQYLQPGSAVTFRVSCHKSRLYHSDAVAERVLGAINDFFERFSKSACTYQKGKPGQLILVRIDHDLCTISVDSSGEQLHRRGYRLETAKAPLRENLAAGIILLSGWSESKAFVDPFCGSGTLPIEAAMIAQNIPPGINRDFAFFQWPIHQKDLWQAQLRSARQGILLNQSPIAGFDRDRGAIEAARSNAARAGLLDRITFVQQAISYLEPPAPEGWIITNPPYGVRVSENKDLRDLYARFGAIFLHRFPSWSLAVLTTDDLLVSAMGLGEPKQKIHLVNGGIPVHLSLFPH